MTSFVNRGIMAIYSVAALAGMGFAAGAIPQSNFSGVEATVPRVPKKAVKAARRLKFAEPRVRWPRSKNPPHKRQRKSNRLIISKRVRRKHRRAAR